MTDRDTDTIQKVREILSETVSVTALIEAVESALYSLRGLKGQLMVLKDDIGEVVDRVGGNREEI